MPHTRNLPFFIFYLVPLCLGAGIAVYFAWPTEPVLWPAWSIAIGALVAAILCRKRYEQVMASCAVALVGLGFALAGHEAHSVAAPVLNYPMQRAQITGVIAEVQTREKGMRLLIEKPSISRLTPQKTPQRIRVSFRQANALVEAGDRVHFTASLFPPSPPAIPGGYNFQRAAFFDAIGAVGYSFASPKLLRPEAVDQQGWYRSIQQDAQHLVRRAREEIAAMVHYHVPMPEAAIATALLVGDRGAIPEATYETLKQAGLAHLLAISGLHMGLIAAFIFFTVRRTLAAIPTLALRWHLKKVAAIVALVGTGIYLLLSGAPVSAQRASMMIALVLLAVMLDRHVQPMRLLAIAATMLLLMAPHQLLSAGFQLSFAATFALIAFYQRYSQWQQERFYRQEPDMLPWPVYWLQKIVTGVGALALSSLIATLATAPYSLYHFNMVTAAGVVANIVALPLASFIIMPAGVIALMLMPFESVLGLEFIPLFVMQHALSFLLGASGWLVHAMHWVLHVPPVSAWMLSAMTMALLWMGLSNHPKRWLVVPVVCAVLVIDLWRYQPPDLLAEEDYIAFRTGGDWQLLGARTKGNWTTGLWQGVLGVEAFADAKHYNGLRCDRLACVIPSLQAEIVMHPMVWRDACNQASYPGSLVVDRYGMSRTQRAQCGVPVLIATERALNRSGAIAAWKTEDGWRFWRGSEVNADRLWGGNVQNIARND